MCNIIDRLEVDSPNNRISTLEFSHSFKLIGKSNGGYQKRKNQENHFY